MRSWIPTVDDMADATAAMLAAHGYSRAAVVAHSYGTTIASRLVIKYPQLVHSMCLTDPVSVHAMWGRHSGTVGECIAGCDGAHFSIGGQQQCVRVGCTALLRLALLQALVVVLSK